MKMSTRLISNWLKFTSCVPTGTGLCTSVPRYFAPIRQPDSGPRRYRASDHLASQTGAIVMAQLICWRCADAGLSTLAREAGDRYENCRQERMLLPAFLQSDQ